MAKWLKDNEVKVLEWPSPSPDLNPIEHLWAEPDQLCQEEWANIHTTYCGKLIEGYLKHLTQVKQFKGNATKYSLSVCKLLTNMLYNVKKLCIK